MKKPLLVLFDGNAIVHRAFHAMKTPLTVRRTGEIVSAVYGFTLMLLKVIADLKPTHYAISFDKAAPTFRHKLFDKYKAQRPPTHEELIGQLGRVRQIVEAFRIPVFQMEGFEADDVLGTLSEQAKKLDIETIIVTGDADTMQLVSPGVKVLYPKPGGSFSDTMLYGEPEVVGKFGVAPHQVADYKALVGDPSDNIPGVPQVGPKTTAKLLNQFGSLEQVYARIDEVAPESLRERLRQNEASAFRSKELATIVTTMPVTLDLEKCRAGDFERKQVTDLFRELEFSSLLARLPPEESLQPTARVAAPQRTCHVVTTEQSLEDMLGRLSSVSTLALDLQAEGADAMSATVAGVSVSSSAGEAYYIPAGHADSLPQVLDRVRHLLENATVARLTHNGKYDTTVLAEHGVTVGNLTFDTSIAAYLLGENKLTVDALAFGRLGVEIRPPAEPAGRGKKPVSLADVPVQDVADYSCARADLTIQLAGILQKELREHGLWQLFADVEMPLLPVLIRLERNGILLDTGLLHRMSRELGEQLLRLRGEIFGAVGHEFNVNSTQQLSDVLFREIKLPGTRRARGAYTTEAAELEKLRHAHPVVGLILDYRQLTKLKSTYIDALPELVNPRTGRLHTNFNQTRTATGRLSSSDPNLQNIPVRGELGRKVRQAFIAPPGHLLMAGDYSQIDLRALAHLSRDESLLRAFHNNEDIHSATAAQLFGVIPAQVTPDMRRLAKTVNFGVIYGMSEYGLEQATELSREDAAKFIAAYFEKHPGVRQYLEKTKRQARESGYVQTLLGRKRLIPDIDSRNHQIREAAERMAINMPVQGTSADIIKVAMINLDREMLQRRLKSKMLLQVHDELIFEVPEDEVAELRALVPQVMSSAVLLSVPLKVDVKTGHNWGEME